MSLYSPRNNRLLENQQMVLPSPQGDSIQQYIPPDQQQQFELFKPFRELPKLSQQEQLISGKNESIQCCESPKVIPASQSRKKQSLSRSPQLPSSNMLRLLHINNLVKKFIRILTIRSHVVTNAVAKKIKSSRVFQEKYLQNKRDHYQESLFTFVLEPTNKFIIFWDIIKGITVLFSLLLIPFNWSFSEEQKGQEQFEITAISVFLILDVLLKLNIAVIDKGNIIKQRDYIIREYFLGSFIFDLSFIVNLQFATRSYNIGFLIIFCFIGFIKFQQVINKIVTLLNLSVVFREFVSLFNLLLTINIIAHFMACIWHYIGMSTIKFQNTSWILEKDLQNEEVYVRYIFSYYWAIVTMITVGYGDITPKNYIEAFSCIFLMLLSCAVFTFSINQVGTIVQNLNKQKKSFEEMLRILSAYMKDHAVPEQLQSRAKNYLEYRCVQRNQQSKYNLQNILDQLSSTLQQELMLNVFKNLLQERSLISLNFTEETIRKMSGSLQTIYFCPDDFICHQDSIDDNHLYFIDYGRVEIFEKNSKHRCAELIKGSLFGDESFFTQKPKKYSVISRTFTKVLRISSTTFLSLLNSEEMEVYQQIRHQYLFNMAVPGRRCKICGELDHLMSQCQLINYIPDIEKLIVKDNNQVQQRVPKFQRKSMRSQKATVIAKQLKLLQKNLENQLFDAVEFEDDEEHEISISQIVKEQNENLDIQDSPKPKRKESVAQKVSELSLQVDGANQNTKNSVDSPKRILKQKSDAFSKTKNQQQNTPHSETENKIINLQQASNAPQSFSQKVIHIDGFDKAREYKKFLVKNNLHVVLQDYNRKARIINKLINQKKDYFLFDHSLRKGGSTKRKSTRFTQIH